MLIGGAVLAYGGYRLLNTEEGSGIVTRLTAAEIEQQQPSVSLLCFLLGLYLYPSYTICIEIYSHLMFMFFQ